tara:strand:+ start:556 stop:849 length:294 start_codon:yes stop_codon:yes gene_type:complete
MICGYCYNTGIPEKHEYDVSHWWNCPPDTNYVCSDSCYTKLEKLVKDGKWMDHKPAAIFGKKKRKPSPSFDKPSIREKGPKSVTDKQFSGDLGKFMT